VQSDLGIPADNVMITSTHTHCGPGALARDGVLVNDLATRIAAVVSRAANDTVPVEMSIGKVEIGDVSHNRREADGVTDRQAQVLVLRALDGGRPPTTIVSFPCHATVLDHETRAYSADFPGAVCRTIEAVLGGTAIYLQGCAGNINPIFTEHTARECRRVGGVIGSAAARVACELGALGHNPRVINLSWDEEIPIAPSVDGRLVTPVRLGSRRRSVSALRRERPSGSAVAAEAATVAAQAAASGTDARRQMMPRAAELWIEGLFANGDETFDLEDVPTDQVHALEVQVFLLGRDLALVGLPGEPFVETGIAVRGATTADVITAGYANQACGYLPIETAFARSGYEVGSSNYPRGTAESLTRLAGSLIDELIRGQR
jgi:hypothetical protein